MNSLTYVIEAHTVQNQLSVFSLFQNRMLAGTRRKIEALRDVIKQIDQEIGMYLVDDLNNDPAVLGRSSIERS